MKIEYTKVYPRECRVEEYIATNLYDPDPEEHNGEIAQEALGRLVDLLCEKGLLTADDVVHIADTRDTDPVLKKYQEN